MLAFVLVAFLSSAVNAPVPPQRSVATGLTWDQGIFVQEYWRSGKPRYAIANQGTKAATITAFEQATGHKLMGPWVVRPKQIVHVNADRLLAKELVEFKLETGQSLGLLNAPHALPARAKTRDKIVTYEGLNGSGGSHDDLWFEQLALEFRPRSVIELTLALQSNIGEIVYLRSKVPILEAKCSSLSIQSTDEKIIIDTNKSNTNNKLHYVTLRVLAPSVDQPTMMVVDGWRWVVPQKIGHSVTRGIAIVPRK